MVRDRRRRLRRRGPVPAGRLLRRRGLGRRTRPLRRDRGRVTGGSPHPAGGERRHRDCSRVGVGRKTTTRTTTGPRASLPTRPSRTVVPASRSRRSTASTRSARTWRRRTNRSAPPNSSRSRCGATTSPWCVPTRRRRRASSSPRSWSSRPTTTTWSARWCRSTPTPSRQRSTSWTTGSWRGRVLRTYGSSRWCGRRSARHATRTRTRSAGSSRRSWSPSTISASDSAPPIGTRTSRASAPTRRSCGATASTPGRGSCPAPRSSSCTSRSGSTHRAVRSCTSRTSSRGSTRRTGSTGWSGSTSTTGTPRSPASTSSRREAPADPRQLARPCTPRPAARLSCASFGRTRLDEAGGHRRRLRAVDRRRGSRHGLDAHGGRGAFLEDQAEIYDVGLSFAVQREWLAVRGDGLAPGPEPTSRRGRLRGRLPPGVRARRGWAPIRGLETTTPTTCRRARGARRAVPRVGGGDRRGGRAAARGRGVQPARLRRRHCAAVARLRRDRPLAARVPVRGPSRIRPRPNGGTRRDGAGQRAHRGEAAAGGGHGAHGHPGRRDDDRGQRVRVGAGLRLPPRTRRSGRPHGGLRPRGLGRRPRPLRRARGRSADRTTGRWSWRTPRPASAAASPGCSPSSASITSRR